MGISDTTGYSATFDKLYNCLYTTNTKLVLSGEQPVVVEVSDGTTTVTTNTQTWYFNPAISIKVSFDSGTEIQFPAAQPGQTVYSTNTLKIQNTGAGGVDLAVYLVGHDLTGSIGSLCPISNVLNINNMAYRCKVGTYVSEVFTPISHLKEANGCRDLSSMQCLVEDAWLADSGSKYAGTNNNLLPDASSAFTSILYNQHTAECWFKLDVPIPCLGTFSATDAVDVLVRAI
jgi:hypothetical protein